MAGSHPRGWLAAKSIKKLHGAASSNREWMRKLPSDRVDSMPRGKSEPLGHPRQKARRKRGFCNDPSDSLLVSAITTKHPTCTCFNRKVQRSNQIAKKQTLRPRFGFRHPFLGELHLRGLTKHEKHQTVRSARLLLCPAWAVLCFRMFGISTACLLG